MTYDVRLATRLTTPVDRRLRMLVLLKGHLQRGWYLTKFRKQFDKAEMTHDLDLVPATILGLTA